MKEGFKGKTLRKRTFLKAGVGKWGGGWGVGNKGSTERDKVEQQHAESCGDQAWAELGKE